MANTDNLSMPQIAAAQAQKHVTHNEALKVLDAVVMLSIIDKDLTAPPGSPAAGDRYIVGASATGAWSGQDGNLAAYQDSAWEFYAPQEGWMAWVEDEQACYRYDSAWVQQEAAQATNGSAIKMRVVEEELTGLSGATAVTSIAFPNQSIILGVATRVTTAITGATSFDCGDGTTVGRFGATLGVTLGSTNQGTIGPAGNYASTTVTLTANGSNFTGGAVRVSIMYIELQPATS